MSDLTGPQENTVDTSTNCHRARMYLQNLLHSVAPQCIPLPTAPGLCTQLDNYITGLREALTQIDAIGNGISKDDQRLTATASLMRCGKIARAALTGWRDGDPMGSE